MDLSHPARDLLGENTERILHRLSILPGGETGNRIHQLSGSSSQRSTQRELDRLVSIGIVDAEPIGNARRYRLNRSHVLWDVVERALTSLARTEDQIGECVRTAVGPDVIACVYGSFARGEAGPGSDIDILIVWPAEMDYDSQTRALDAIDTRTRSLTGNDVQIVNVTRADLQRMMDADDPLITSWKRDARTLTHGATIEQLLVVTA